MQNFYAMDPSELASQLTQLSAQRTSPLVSPPDFLKPQPPSNVIIHAYSESNENKELGVSSASNLAGSLENSARGGFGADMISRQFYTNDLKELGIDEPESGTKKPEVDIFADFGEKLPVTKRVSSEFENFLGEGNFTNNQQGMEFFNNGNFGQNNQGFPGNNNENQGQMDNNTPFEFTNNNNPFQTNITNTETTFKKDEGGLERAKPDDIKQQKEGLNLDDFGDLEEEKSGKNDQSLDNSRVLLERALEEDNNKPRMEMNISSNLPDFWNQGREPLKIQEEKPGSGKFIGGNQKSGRELAGSNKFIAAPEQNSNDFFNAWEVKPDEKTMGSMKNIKGNEDFFQEQAQNINSNAAFNVWEQEKPEEKLAGSNKIIKGNQDSDKFIQEQPKNDDDFFNQWEQKKDEQIIAASSNSSKKIIQQPLKPENDFFNAWDPKPKEQLMAGSNKLIKGSQGSSNFIQEPLKNNNDFFNEWEKKQDDKPAVSSKKIQSSELIKGESPNDFSNPFETKKEPFSTKIINDKPISSTFLPSSDPFSNFDRKIEQKPIANQIAAEKNEVNVLTEDQFLDADGNKSERSQNSQNLDNSTEFFHNSMTHLPEDSKPIEIQPKVSNPPPDNNTLSFWESINVVEKFKNSSDNLDKKPNEGINILDGLQRTPSSIDRKRSYEEDPEDFRLAHSTRDLKNSQKSLNIIEENKEVIQNKEVPNRSLKDLVAGDQLVNTGVVSFKKKSDAEGGRKKQDSWDFEGNDFLKPEEKKQDVWNFEVKNQDLLSPGLFSNEEKPVISQVLEAKSKAEEFNLLSPGFLESPANNNQFQNASNPINNNNMSQQPADNWFLSNNEMKSPEVSQQTNIDTARTQPIKQPFAMDFHDADSFGKTTFDPSSSSFGPQILPENFGSSSNEQQPKIANNDFDTWLENNKPMNTANTTSKNPFDNPMNFLNNTPIMAPKPNQNEEEVKLSPGGSSQLERSNDLIENQIPGQWNLDPQQLDRANNLIVFSDQNSDDRKTQEQPEKPEEWYDAPNGDDAGDLFKDFTQVKLNDQPQEEALVQEEKRPKIVNSLRKNEFAIREELGTIQEENEEHDLSLRHEENKGEREEFLEFDETQPRILDNGRAKALFDFTKKEVKSSDKPFEIMKNAEKSEKPSEILTNISPLLAYQNPIQQQDTFIASKEKPLVFWNQDLVKPSLSSDKFMETEAKFAALTKEFESLRQGMLSQPQQSPQKLDTLERSLLQMQQAYGELRRDQETLKQELKLSVTFPQQDKGLQKMEDDLKTISEKVNLKDSQTEQGLKTVSNELSGLQGRQIELEAGYRENQQKFVLLFETTKALLEKTKGEGDQMALEAELRKNQAGFEASQGSYSALKAEFSTVLMDFQREVDGLKSETLDVRNNRDRLKEFQNVSKEKLDRIENTVGEFKGQFQRLQEFYEVLQSDITKISRLLVGEQEGRRKMEGVGVEIRERLEERGRKLMGSVSSDKVIRIDEIPEKLMEPAEKPMESPPNKRKTAVTTTSSVFNISITPPRNPNESGNNVKGGSRMDEGSRSDTIKKGLAKMGMESPGFSKKEILENSRLSYSDFKEKQIKIDSQHQILISPIRNNPLESIERFCNEFNQQDPSDREKVLRKTYRNDGVFKKVWQDPYELLREFEDKNKQPLEKQQTVYNFNGDVKISMNQNNNNSSLNFDSYKSTYGGGNRERYMNSLNGGNSKNPNFYLCREKFKRKIVYVGKRELAKLIRNMNTASAIFKTDVKNFKKACLSSSTVLFENGEVQIGSKTSVKGNQIRMSLFISNKSKTILNHFCLRLRPRTRTLRGIFIYLFIHKVFFSFLIKKVRLNPEKNINIPLFEPGFSINQEFIIDCSPEETFEFLLIDVLY